MPYNFPAGQIIDPKKYLCLGYQFRINHGQDWNSKVEETNVQGNENTLENHPT